MDLLSLPYAIFVAGTALLFHCLPGKFRPLLLAVASLLLYGYYSPVSAVILVAAAGIVFGAARALDSLESSAARRSMILIGVLGTLLAYLTLIKLLPLLRERGHAPGAERVVIALGVSYYTFKLLGYLIDVYWRKYPAWTDPVLFLAFATFFPQLPAGPIQRANEFALPGSGEETAIMMAFGLKRIFWGLIKKTVVADQLGSIIGYIDGTQPQFSNLLWIAACLYALEMYFDFAALTDIAIGTAGLFGIRSPENFAYPFFAPSISQFWRRWHMSLTLWLTDYVFTPLRMSTRNLGNWGLVLSITVNMVLIGLWHGIGIGFLFFGLIHSVYLIADSLTASWRRKYYRRHQLADRVTNLIGPFAVFAMVVFALVFFRAVTMTNIIYQMRHLGDGLFSPIASMLQLRYNYGGKMLFLSAIATAAALGIEMLHYLRPKSTNGNSAKFRFESWPGPLRWIVYYAGTAIVVTLHQQHVHFIYVQF
jgi:D-alanyl-lipoteichoic acid acyltransferase DltB (MBOAT superfamily)